MAEHNEAGGERVRQVGKDQLVDVMDDVARLPLVAADRLHAGLGDELAGLGQVGDLRVLERARLA